jgi:dethiobiotin synthetase
MRILFITGTDTSVGKTTVTALAAAHLSKSAINFRAVKPFCSGERTDAVLLGDLELHPLPLEEINPFYFPEPLGPWTAARRSARKITLQETIDHLTRQALACDLLLIEGAGGLLSPLGERFAAADLMVELHAEPIVVAANRLGVLNQTALTLEALASRELKCQKVILVDVARSEPVSATNEEDLRILFPECTILRVQFLPDYRPEAAFIRSAAGPLSHLLAELVK